MKALIIGGGGFVGGYLAEYLNNSRYEVCVTKLPNEVIKNNKLKTYDMDVLNFETVDDLLAHEMFDHIYYLAAQSSVALSWDNPGLTIDVNVKGVSNFLEVIRKLRYETRILLIGSGEEYGYIEEGECPVDENKALRPSNIYAATKACQNMLGKIYANAYAIEIMMVRAFNHIGPRQSPQFVISDFCKQVAEIEAGIREPIIYVGNLNVERDFTDVRDVVRAYELIMNYGKKGETYNVGSGQAIKVKTILKKILGLSACPIQIEVDPQKNRPIDIPVVEASIDKLTDLTGWRREIPLDQTLSECLNYWRAKQ